jgi:hypothetical protein
MNDFARPIDITSSGRVSYGLDDGLLVEFYIKPKLMEALTDERGMPTYEDRVYTRIVSPGNTKTTWDYETKGVDYEYDEDGQVTGYRVRDDLQPEQCDPIRFPKAWERFTKKGEKVKEGWAIEEWGAITRSFAQNLKAMNVHTVEALAGLSDAAAANLMGGLKYRNLAKAALDEQKLLEIASAEQERANKAIEEKKALEAKIAAMQAQIDALTKPPKGKAA